MMNDVILWLAGNAVAWGVKLGLAITILIVGRFLARAIRKLVKRALNRFGTDRILVSFLGGMAYWILLVAVVLAAFDTLGVNVTSLLAVMGAAGLAVGLALKDSLANFASGVMIVIFRPFTIGDLITAGGSSGVVGETGLFCTTLHTTDNQKVIVPNSAVFGGTIVNVSAMATRRIDLVIGIGYNANINEARDVIMGVLRSHSHVLNAPPPDVSVAELGDISVKLNVRPWIDSTGNYWSVHADLLEQIKGKLDEAGIVIPYTLPDSHA